MALPKDGPINVPGVVLFNLHLQLRRDGRRGGHERRDREHTEIYAFALRLIDAPRLKQWGGRPAPGPAPGQYP